MARARSAARSLARSALADFINPPNLVTLSNYKPGIV
jgi:hypothetical protein